MAEGVLWSFNTNISKAEPTSKAGSKNIWEKLNTRLGSTWSGDRFFRVTANSKPLILRHPSNNVIMFCNLNQRVHVGSAGNNCWSDFGHFDLLMVAGRCGSWPLCDEQWFILGTDDIQQPATFALDYSWEFLAAGGILKLLEVEPETHAVFLV